MFTDIVQFASSSFNINDINRNITPTITIIIIVKIVNTY